MPDLPGTAAGISLNQVPTGWRPRGADAIYVCEGCGIVVQPDLEACPNALGVNDDAHALAAFVRRGSRSAPLKRSFRYRWTMATERFRRSLARRIYDFEDGW